MYREKMHPAVPARPGPTRDQFRSSSSGFLNGTTENSGFRLQLKCVEHYWTMGWDKSGILIQVAGQEDTLKGPSHKINLLDK
jgi:hypothetical protein